MASVSIENVSVIFGRDKRALKLADKGLSRDVIKQKTGAVLGAHNCSAEVGEGQTLVLIGLSGSGKSTLLRTVNGLAKPARGQVILRHGGQSYCINALRRHELYQVRTHLVSMVFQQFGLLPWRSVADNVGLGLEIAGVARAKARGIIMAQLELVGLEKWADVPVSSLSGGMQQRVGLARAFATGAPVLLMDEPFSALDPLIRKRLQGELLELQKQFRKTVIFVSHDMEEAIRMGDRIALMEDGRIVQTGTPKEIILSPAAPLVERFVRDINPLSFLTAADIMRPYDEETARQPFAAMVTPDTPLRELIRIICEKPGIIGVAGPSGAAGILLSEDIVFYTNNNKNR